VRRVRRGAGPVARPGAGRPCAGRRGVGDRVQPVGRCVTERRRRACSGTLRTAPTVRRVSAGRARPSAPSAGAGAADPTAPALFSAAVAALNTVRPRPEIALDTVPPPQRLAPWTHAISAEVLAPGVDEEDDDAPLASARLVLLHDPDGQQAWDGVL